MGRKVYIGRASSHLGKTAFQLLANLRNFGVGRMLTRHEWDHWPEPSYHVVHRVETRMDPELKFGTLWCETVIRGQRLPGIRPVRVTYRPDFRLIPRHEEENFLRGFNIRELGEEQQVLPRDYSLPPLMLRWLKRHQALSAHPKAIEAESKHEPLTIPFVYQTEKEAKAEDADLFWVANRVAQPGEKPTVPFDGKFHFAPHYLQHCKSSRTS